MTAVDWRSRVADHPVLAALDWTPGTRLTIHHARGLLVLRCDTHPVLTISPQGYLRLPRTLCHRYALAAGGRVLPSAPSPGVLIAHPTAALEDLLPHHHAQLLNGDFT